jgi:Tfp pilus assembly protein PilP
MHATAVGLLTVLLAVAVNAQPQTSRPPTSQLPTSQAPRSQAPRSQAPRSQPTQTPERAAPDSYRYDAAGRRDPFLSLIGTGFDPPSTGSRTEGAAGLTVGEISVRGIVQSRGTLIAMVQGPDNKTYLVHQGDKFVDGTLKSITPEGLVFLQDVRDPLSLVTQREVRKPLRAAESAKP